MPGLVGIIDRSNRASQTSIMLESMLACMMHRRSFVCGKLTGEKHGLALGWVAHKGSFSDCMPTWNADRNICLIFSGEDYSSSENDASSLVSRYEKLGSSFYESLNGIFSGLILDLRENKIFLFN